jgi:hypothetical protein
MFMLFLINFEPLITVSSWAFFKRRRNCFAVLFGCLDFIKSFIAFWRRGSVGLTFRICFAPDFVGFNRYAFIPAFATFSAPCIFTDFIFSKILSNWLVLFILIYIIVSIKVCRILYKACGVWIDENMGLFERRCVDLEVVLLEVSI